MIARRLTVMIAVLGPAHPLLLMIVLAGGSAAVAFRPSRADADPAGLSSPARRRDTYR
ncbi:MAG: hypothetical protein ACYDAL_10195 [Candidatus Dormibacteraceae bacterium]